MNTEPLQNSRYIPSSTVRELCGGISDMSLWRWLNSSDFPAPVRINRRRYWKETDVLDWLEAQRETA